MSSTILPLHHNVGEFSVSEISNILKKNIEENFSYIRIRGEVSGLKIAPSGHVYFSLKDDNAIIAAICWKGTASKMPIKLEEGLEIVCLGSLTTYAMQSKYQLIVEKFEISGIGALMTLLNKRKDALAKEGLFAQARKKPLPKFPQTIAIVTSPTGAVIRDILHRLSARMPVHVLLWPVLVQGEKAAEQIANAINGLNEITPAPDLIIVARGGGSLEDLWAFNEEIVVRAAANSRIPLISAVGHETDTTLIDYASDLRAPTPSAAAEMAVPVRSELLLLLRNYDQRLTGDLIKLLEAKTNILVGLKRGLPNCQTLIDNMTQRLDDLAIRCQLALPRLIVTKQNNIYAFTLTQPKYIIDKSKNKLNLVAQTSRNNLLKFMANKTHNLELFSSSLKINLLLKDIASYSINYNSFSDRLNKVSDNIFTPLKNKLEHVSALFNSYNYKNTLNRGFALIKTKDNKAVFSSDELKPNQEYIVEMKDGSKVVKAI